jgi:hypothetical protein
MVFFLGGYPSRLQECMGRKELPLSDKKMEAKK